MGRFSGLAEAMSVVADKLKADREMEQKQNLLGMEGLIKGNISPAQEGEEGFSVPGMGRVKSTMADGMTDVGVIDPITGEVTKTGQVPRGSRFVKGVLSPEQMQERAVGEGKAKSIVKDIEISSKLSGAVKRLAILNKQYSKALPSGDKTPLEQRISGNFQAWASKKGLINNPELVALQKNIRPIAINMIRAFGEVGNLSESEQQGAIDVVNQASLTDTERIAATKQFIEFALAGASPEGIRVIKERNDIKGILNAFSVNLGESQGIATEVNNQDISEEDIQYTLQKHPYLTREQLLKKLGV